MSLTRQILVVILLSGLVYGGYTAWQRFDGGSFATAKSRPDRIGPTSVEAAPASLRDISTIIEAVGSTVASQSIEIVPRAEGRIEKINFNAGGDVAAGDVLAELDNDLEQADLVEAEALLRQANLELERARSLSENKIMAKSALEEIITKKATAEAALIRARQKLSDRTVTAPFAGTTGLRRVDVGARVTETTVITTLDDLSSVEIEFFISEQLYGLAEVGQAVVATTVAYPGRVFEGVLAEIDSRVDPNSRSFKVRARIPNRDRALPAGMFMHVRMELASDNVVTVPEEAIVAEADASYVFIVDGEKVERRRIKVGRREVGYAEITEGLTMGALVVTRGVNKLRDGMPVTLVEPEQGANQ